MAFKDAAAEYRLLDLSLLDPDPEHPRRQQDEAALKGLAHAIGKKGVLQPLLVQPADAAGRYRVIAGERRRQAALLAGETQVPVLIRACPADEVLEVQVFENLGLGVRAALEPRDMANAIQRIADRFETPNAAAEQFGRSPTWLNQATAAANLSPKVSALLESGKIGSATTAVQIEKLAQKDEASAESLLEKIEQLAEGEKLPRELVEDLHHGEPLVEVKPLLPPLFVEKEAKPAPFQLSGKLITNEHERDRSGEKLERDNYFDKVDGAQLNFEFRN